MTYSAGRNVHSLGRNVRNFYFLETTLIPRPILRKITGCAKFSFFKGYNEFVKKEVPTQSSYADTCGKG